MCPPGPLCPGARRGGGSPQVIDESQHELPQCTGPDGIGPQLLSPPDRRVGIGLGQLRLGFAVGRVGCKEPVPVFAPGDHAGIAREPLPGRYRERASPVVHPGTG